MAMTINTNVVSINSQRNLSLSASSLATSMQRLSSGLRVNSAKDDAAGLAISERMKAQSSGLAVAARNANDGISLAQTAEGALSKVGDMLQRMRELAVQSSNATNSENDRKAMQAEVSQLVSEIDRVAKTSEFNGKKLLNGDFAGGVFQVGASAGDNITVGGLVNAKAAELADVKYYKTAGKESDLGAQVLNPATGAVTTAGFETAVTGLKVNDVALDNIGTATSKAERMGQIVAAINAKTADTGVTAFYENGSVELRSSNADKGIKLEGFSKAVTALDETDNTVAATAFQAANAAGSAAAKGLTSLTVEKQSDAWLALKKIDSAINQVNSARGDLGALQTRFEKSIENIDIQNENISAARGRIVDADFAAETANLSRSQILQQAGTAMVAQANQLPQNVLSLLR
ncbi:flagellin [Comamonas kerstersii]|uniref:flagellin N-terminal helical domain-containing protein n=1 Tax=Comamonas kerstersii TaxID=225992 RepID=UPI001B3282D4|nr:flagellin [Comamonas kerstersii]QTW18958.1 flagellin [Comamonas kerstersii]